MNIRYPIYEGVYRILTLKQGYASIGYERGRNIHVDLNKFLVNKRMIVKEGKGYRYNPDFHY